MFTKTFIKLTKRTTISAKIIKSGSNASWLNSPFEFLIEKSIYDSETLAPWFFIIVIRFESPYPTRILKMGPAIVAVTAISPNPFFVIATSADISPKQFPQDSTVRDNKAYGNLVINPKIFTKSTTHPEAKLIHAILYKNDSIEKNVIKSSGPSDLLVLLKIIIPIIDPGIIIAILIIK